MAASRLAKRLLVAAQSPLWGETSGNGRHVVDETLRELCLFDEHSWGSSKSVAFPYDFDSQGQAAEKACLAYRPMARAQWLLGQRARSRLAAEGEGLYLANTAPLGVERLGADARQRPAGRLSLAGRPAIRRQDARSISRTACAFSWPQDPSEFTREDTAGVYPDNAPRQVAKFWVEGLPGQSIRKLRLSTDDAADDRPPPGRGPTVAVDAQGWPTARHLAGHDQAAVSARAWAIFWPCGSKGSRHAGWPSRCSGPPRRPAGEAPAARSSSRAAATAREQAAVDDDPHTIVYTQAIAHPRLRWATRRLEVWKGEPRARFTLRLDRISSEVPETFYIVFPLPCQSVMPQTSCGGVPFVPFRDQLPGTCRDYFAIDGWVHYATPAGHWFWASRDAPLVTFGGPQTKARRERSAAGDAPRAGHDLRQFLVHQFRRRQSRRDGVPASTCSGGRNRRRPSRGEDLARTLASEPQVMINPGLKEDPIVLKRLYEP